MIRDSGKIVISNRSIDTERRLSPNSRRSSGVAAMVWQGVRAEFLKYWREPSFVVGTVVFPTMLFVLFGLPNAGQTLPEGLSVGAFMMASFGAYGLLGITIFSFGVGVATERGQGWMRLIRVTPMPAWTYFLSKIVMSLFFGLLALLLLYAVAYLAAGVRLTVGEFSSFTLTLLLGALPFSALGFALGYWASPNSASTIANLVYLPLSFVSGLFIPLRNLPQILQDVAPYVPTYHYGQLVWRSIGSEADVAFLAGSSEGIGLQVAWLAGTLVVFGLLAIFGYRRDQDKQFA